MDKHTQKRIEKLHPFVRDEVEKIINECNEVLTGNAKVRITQGLRTFEEQNALYNKGRTVSGKKVTNAKAGQSIHNYGFAVDICLIINNKIASWNTVKDWDNDTVADWYECVKIFSKYDWEWGGNWKSFKDLPHFEKNGFNNWRKLIKLDKDQNGYVVI
ncbi:MULTISPECIES: M15 family metallopeptidase [Flavobacterium]|jgi:peptidoglycan L-alanyl-D-glutamate endopeptidase CwlK|uniref:M15 family metallopeptidase n=1 Tax=Flavobacterium jumunjinense TaxID=998845 RepID=A0ABV5GQQ5_9FLAO|nr:MULTISPECIES: M15 family metallopeptidase [Flavobacterium]